MKINTFHSKIKHFLKQRKLLSINLLVIVVLVFINSLFIKFEVGFLNNFIDTPKDINNVKNPIDRILWFNNLKNDEFKQIFTHLVDYILYDEDIDACFIDINSFRSHYNDRTIQILIERIKEEKFKTEKL